MLILYTVLAFLAIGNTKEIIPYNPKSYKLMYKGPNGEVRYKDDCECLYLACYGGIDIYEAMPIITTTIHSRVLFSFECLFPPKPLVETLTSLNINASNIEVFGFSRVLNDSAMTKGDYMTGMNITTLSITTAPDALKNNQDFLCPLNNLKTLHIHKTTVPPIPPHLTLEELQITNYVLIKKWDNCQYLQVLKMQQFSSENIPSVWPSNCSSLTHLYIIMTKDIKTTELVLSTVGVHCGNLLNLTMEYCRLDRLPNEVLNIAKYLQYLNLNHNLIDDNAFAELPLLESLTVLDLTSNKVTGIFLSNIVEKLPALRELIIYDNFITNVFCTFGTKLSSFQSYLTSLERLSLNRVSPDCLKDFHLNNLTYLGINDQERIKNFKIEDLPKTNASFLDVDMKESFVERIEFDEDDYKALKSLKSVTVWKGQSVGPNLTLYFRDIDCDCDNYWFALALREYPDLLSLPDLKCHQNERNFKDEDLMHFNCTKENRNGCIVRKRVQTDVSGKSNNTMTIECHKLDEIHFSNSTFDSNFKFIGLDVSGNDIKTLNNIWMSTELQSIDLRDNSISRLEENDTKRLFNSPKRRIWLSGNLLLCDCESKSMLDALHTNKGQIVDFDDLICVDSEQPLRSVTSYEACHIESRILIGMLVATLVVLLILAALVWRYRFKIKIYIYAQGWCLFCLSEEEDQDKPYDAFLSFAHGDWDIVVEELLPKLEGEPDKFRVCVHYRDWSVGDWIPNQIMRSVNLSKRTIIVLSKNFITSLWSTLEFRYALASSANEGRSRLLVIVLDDVLQQVVDPELTQYLTYNTYLHYEDSWFWEKLRYAMPYRRDKRNQTERIPNIHSHMPSDGHGIIDVNSREVFVMQPLAIRQ